MNRVFVFILLGFLFPLISFGQRSSTNTDFTRVKDGTFYFYPRNNSKGFTIIRKGSEQQEIEHSTGDTTIWGVNWQNESVFNVKFIRKSKPMPEEQRSFYNSHTVVFKLLEVKKGYYIFRAGIDSIDNPRAFTDTMWIKSIEFLHRRL